MSYQNQNFGMMDQGYFVARSQILNWINDLLKLNLTKIQQLGSGSVYCQIIDVIHPGSITMNKLNWKAKNDYEFISNMKILQNAFSKVGIKRYVEVEKLSKAKYQDNLEFIQWLKRYYDKNCGDRGNNYDAQQRRGNVVIDFTFADKNVVAKTYNANGLIVPGVKTQPQVVEKPKKESDKEKEQIQPNRVIKSPTIFNPMKKIQQKSSKTGSKIKNSGDEQFKRLKEIEGKLQLISQIIQLTENSDIKIKLIEQILLPEKQDQIKYENHHHEEQIQSNMI